MTRIEAVRAVVRMSRLLERSCADLSPELSLAHYRILAAVADGAERASRVAARLALGKPTVSASVDALCRRHLLVRDGVSGDQRAVALRLTDDGRAVLAEAERLMLARLDAVLALTDDPSATAAAVAGLGAGLDRWADEQSEGHRLAGRQA